MESESTIEEGNESSQAVASDACSCSQEAQEQDTVPISIYNLPNGVLEHVSSFLAAPSKALFAVALDDSRNELRRDVSLALVTNQCWNTLDFGEIEEELAAKLSDEDIKNTLVRINAVNSVTQLRLTNCVNILGSGLKPLCGSKTIEHIDLSLVRDNRSPIIDPEPALCCEQVLPILESIISSKGNAVRLVQFPWIWRQQGFSTDPDSEFNLFLKKYDTHMRNRLCSCLNCNKQFGWLISTHDNNLWYGSQGYTCHQCMKKCCYPATCKDEDGEKFSLALTYCNLCMKDFCNGCSKMTYCEDCDEFYCERCVTVSKCDECNRSLCNVNCRLRECKRGENTCQGCIKLIAPDLLEMSDSLREAAIEMKAYVFESHKGFEQQQKRCNEIHNKMLKVACKMDRQSDKQCKAVDEMQHCWKAAEVEYRKRLRCLEVYLRQITAVLIITVIREYHLFPSNVCIRSVSLMLSHLIHHIRSHASSLLRCILGCKVVSFLIIIWKHL